MKVFKGGLLAAAATLALTACATADDQTSAAPSSNMTAQSESAPVARDTPDPSPSAQPSDQSSVQPTAPPAAGAYTDAQLSAFLAANRDLTPTIQANQANLQGTAEQQAEAQAAISAAAGPILQSHGIDPQTYNAIARQAQTDTALQQRLVALGAPTAP